MAVTADAISDGDLSLRVEPAEPRTEVGRLGLSLNTMLGRIEVAFAERAATEDKLRRFLADASHELRTPLTSIRGYSEVFERAKEDPEDLELAMRRIEEESKRMGVMVEELLVLARLGEGREPEKLPVDLARVVDDCVSDARAASPDREITVDRVETADVLGDDHQLHQVLHNLLRNAADMLPEAHVHVTLATSNGYATLAVTDDGPGLEPDVAAKVFEPFFRADKSRARETGGAGLGLAIVAAIVESHRGTVRIDTAPGAGATFTVTRPLLGARRPEPRSRPRRVSAPDPVILCRIERRRHGPAEGSSVSTSEQQRSPARRIVILTGPSRAGKTTVCHAVIAEAAARGLCVAGILTEDATAGDGSRLQVAVDLRSGARRLLASARSAATAGLPAPGGASISGVPANGWEFETGRGRRLRLRGPRGRPVPALRPARDRPDRSPGAA